ncbi:hypothetical protein Tco_1364587, partial [Tanacetum coccineum]
IGDEPLVFNEQPVLDKTVVVLEVNNIVELLVKAVDDTEIHWCSVEESCMC